ncbi:hypothetical protein ACTMSW_19675 [Micromonospora sp. BQ11]|uniref:hypothetical protein n=1 Tax=Micromonospora sp. BQ11 TaxID=3452212 RepID=UPI003F88D957
MQEHAGYAVAAAAYITTRLMNETAGGPELLEDIRGLHRLVRQRLDDDDHLGVEYVQQSPRSAKARSTLARDIEYAAGEHPGFAAELTSVVDRLREAGGLDYLVAHGGAAVLRQVVDRDRRGVDALRPSLVRALGPGAPDVMLTAAASEAVASPAGHGTTAWQIVYYVLGALAVSGMALAFLGQSIDEKPLVIAGIILTIVFGALVGILHRLPRLRGVPADTV